MLQEKESVGLGSGSGWFMQCVVNLFRRHFVSACSRVANQKFALAKYELAMARLVEDERHPALCEDDKVELASQDSVKERVLLKVQISGPDLQPH